MSPRASRPPSDALIAQLQRLATKRETADNKADEALSELRAAVVAALDAGGSVRTVAAAARISTATVRTWQHNKS